MEENKPKKPIRARIAPLKTLTRRELLQVCGCAGGVIALLPVLAEVAEGQTPVVKGWVSAGKTSRFPLSVPVKATQSDKRVVFVLQEKGGHWLAVSSLCTHKGCAVGWQAKAGKYVCSCHGATFAKDGSGPTAPARLSLATYPVRIQSGQVWIAPAKVQPSSSNAPGKGEEEDGEHDDDKPATTMSHRHDDAA